MDAQKEDGAQKGSGQFMDKNNSIWKPKQFRQVIVEEEEEEMYPNRLHTSSNHGA
jgi:hypothetical protein